MSPARLRGRGEGRGEAVTLKVTERQQGGAGERRTQDNSQPSQGRKATSVRSPGQARLLFSPAERPGTHSMDASGCPSQGSGQEGRWTHLAWHRSLAPQLEERNGPLLPSLGRASVPDRLKGDLGPRVHWLGLTL